MILRAMKFVACLMLGADKRTAKHMAFCNESDEESQLISFRLDNEKFIYTAKYEIKCSCCGETFNTSVGFINWAAAPFREREKGFDYSHSKAKNYKASMITHR